MKKLLIIGYVWPEPTASAAGTRIIQLISRFTNHGYQVYFGSPGTRQKSAFNLEEMGVMLTDIELNNSSFDSFIKELDPEMVIFDRFMMEEQFGWRVAEYCPNALRVLDTEDLHSLRNARQMAIKQKVKFDRDYWLGFELTKRELASIYRSDLSVIISEAEMELLKSVPVNHRLLSYLPFLQNPVSEKKRHQLPDFESRSHFVCVGNFLHAPNRDAVEYLKAVLWPLIRQQLPDAELYVYGAYMPDKTRQLQEIKTGFYLKGFADNIATVMQKARVCLAPLRFGAGLKGKLVDAMQNGTPCVMTTIASEGMFGAMEANGIITDEPQHFADAASQVYRNEALWEKYQSYGFDILEKRFEGVKHFSMFLEKAVKIKAGLKQHRTQNVIGQMLQLHSMKSTKYMAKWIEAKNKTEHP